MDARSRCQAKNPRQVDARCDKCCRRQDPQDDDVEYPFRLSGSRQRVGKENDDDAGDDADDAVVSPLKPYVVMSMSVWLFLFRRQTVDKSPENATKGFEAEA